MFNLYALGFLLIISKLSARQVPVPPPGITIIRTSTSGQYLIQQPPKEVQPGIPPGFSQFAVVLVPRQPGPILYATAPRHVPEENPEDQEASRAYYSQEAPENQQPNHNVLKPQPLAYAQFLPYVPIKKKNYVKQKSTTVHQYLKEVNPTTKTMYSEQQAASLRYAQAAPPQEEDAEEIQKLEQVRIAPQPVPFSYVIHPGVQQDPNQPQAQQLQQQYQPIIQPPQLIQPQHFIQPQHYVQPQQQPSQLSVTPQQFAPKEEPNTQQVKYQQPQLLPQHVPDNGLTYIPINPVMYQKPLVDDESPSPKSSIYVSQRTSIKKQQKLQPIPNEETEEQPEKPQPKKLIRLPLRQIHPQHPQQILIPIIPQQFPIQGEEGQPQLIRLHPIQPLQQIQPEQQVEQQVYPQVRPKKVPSQTLKQQLPQQIITYHQLPIPQQLPTEHFQQFQPVDPAQYQKQPLVKLQLQPQFVAYQPLPSVSVRQPQIQPEQLTYETIQDSESQEDQQEVEKEEDKQPEIQSQEPVLLKQTIKYRKSNLLRPRKFRPIPTRAPTDDEETQPDVQDFREDLRIQLQDGLKPQATSFTSLKYRRPLQVTGKYSSRTKDRAVQIIEQDEIDYK